MPNSAVFASEFRCFAAELSRADAQEKNQAAESDKVRVAETRDLEVACSEVDISFSGCRPRVAKSEDCTARLLIHRDILGLVSGTPALSRNLSANYPRLFRPLSSAALSDALDSYRRTRAYDRARCSCGIKAEQGRM